MLFSPQIAFFDFDRNGCKKTVPITGLVEASERRRLRREFSRRPGLGRRRARPAVGISVASKAPTYHASSFVMCRRLPRFAAATTGWSSAQKPDRATLDPAHVAANGCVLLSPAHV